MTTLHRRDQILDRIEARCNPAHLRMVSHLKNQRLRAARIKSTTTM